ncbi:MAG: adenine-specific methyltransferase EcoRI family protein [Clostridia bacterium]|nr:adenine-specific methyltransferase EcoRI family protein [Clostridia bacterium]
MANEKFDNAKKGKNDEFYTQYADIQKEVNAYLEYDADTFKDKIVLLPCDDPEWSNFTRFFAQNFERLGLKKLISTSYATDSKKFKSYVQLSFLEMESPKYDKTKTNKHGKIFTLTRDTNNSGHIDIDDLEWEYLKGDGDFRSKEVTQLRDEADIIITNPPFSLFREFVDWIMQANKKFLIIGNQNAITYKEIFPLIKNNRMWTGCRFNQRVNGKNMTFVVPDNYPLSGTEVSVDEKGRKLVSVAGTGWFTNLEHGRRHQPLELMTMADNLKYSKHKEIRAEGYPKYVNYDAIDVSFTDAIPDDYKQEMGVPISFLNKYNPEQFEIIALGIVGSIDFSSERKMEILDKNGKPTGKYTINAKGTLYKEWNKNADPKPPAFQDCENGKLYQSIYARIIIRRK